MTEEKYKFGNSRVEASLDELTKRFDHYSERDSSESNETERHLSGQLILLTTVLITVNILFLGDGRILDTINGLQKTGILFALFLEGVATVAGIINYIDIESSYDTSANIWAKCAQIVRDRTQYNSPKKLRSLLEKEQSGIKDRRRLALLTQIIMILLSLMIYIVLLWSVFFIHHKERTDCTKISEVYSLCKS